MGLRTQEWEGLGHNQLLFDDSDQQLGIQLATTQYTTQFNFSHLRHRADNYRGSLRGQGFEIRTDAYGVVRAREGLHLTTWGKDLATPTGGRQVRSAGAARWSEHRRTACKGG